MGAYLLSESFRKGFDVMYWREGNDEVDYVLRINGKIVALEVKSNGERQTRGLDVFVKKFAPHRALIVGENGLPLETLFSMPPEDLIL